MKTILSAAAHVDASQEHHCGKLPKSPEKDPDGSFHSQKPSTLLMMVVYLKV